MQVHDSLLYGMTAGRGINNMGVLFKFNINTSIYTKNVDFNGSLIGSSPLGNLIQSSAGDLYGMTNRGGLNDMGVLFRYDIVSESIIKKLDFDSINGSYPTESLMISNDSILYGMTLMGGAMT